MFDNLINKLQEKSEEQQLYSPNIGMSISMNTDYLRMMIDNMDSYSSEQMRDILKKSYSVLLDDIMYEKDLSYINAFTNTRFLNELIKVIGDVKLEDHQRVCCNKLAYDYLTSDADDDYVKQLLFTMSKIVNKDKVPLLMGLGIPEELCVNMALSRYSSKKEIINVKRLNFVISTAPNELMTVQNIVYIYEVLFDSITPILEGTMFDIYNEEEEWVTDDILDVYGRIPLAVLEILNNMPSVDIRKVLISYTGDYEYLYSKDPNSVRFSMRCLSEDFSRILAVVESLQAEGTDVP